MDIKIFESLSDRRKEEILAELGVWPWVKRGLIGVTVLLTISMAGCPPYNVWKDTLVGKAELKRAEWNRQITIEEALAKKESSKSWAQAEVERAKGSAEANSILAESLGGSEGYLRWLYIDMMGETKNQVIYLATEAGLPILEAQRLQP